jgi:RimJ/RimL family protein N-acetyltransferase
MPPAIILETERLLLRQLDEDDAEQFYQLGRDPEVNRYTFDPCLTSLDEALAVLRARPMADYQKYGFGRWACILKDQGQFIGWAGLKFLDDLQEVDLGYRLLREFWGKGLATEASRAAVAYGFDKLGLKTIIGLVDPANVASVRVLEKCGLSYERMMECQSVVVARYVIESSRK